MRVKKRFMGQWALLLNSISMELMETAECYI